MGFSTIIFHNMFATPKIVFSQIDEDAKLPSRLNISDPDYLIYSPSTKIIASTDKTEISTGLVIEDIVKGVWIMLFPSDLFENVEVFPKTINNSFRGELKIVLYNNSENSYIVNPGDVIAKMTYLPLLTIEPEFIQKNESL